MSIHSGGNNTSRSKSEDEGHTDVSGIIDNTKKLRLESLYQPVDSHSSHEVIKCMPSPLPVKHYDADTTEPVSCGLQTLDELLSWNQSEANPFNGAVVPLAEREPALRSCSRRTLVSHDMMGGYLDDRFVQGTAAEAPYAFYHWQYIDIFNYFTHNLVTIPPAVWTSAAHKHGVLVLGTFITEWTDGAATCEAFLKDDFYQKVADKLVQMSQYYGFDGWLINIENTLSEVAVKTTPLFLRYLTDQMHEQIPGSMVLWYDSVIETGQLKWQNELNQSNRVFFNACDGFFTNYNWTAQNLEWMTDYNHTHGRQADIYVGVDVFARGEVVGGMFETNKALEMIRKYNFSAAIFAPGWVYETQDKTEFRHNQDKFWDLLKNSLYIHRPSVPLPFISSFCQGFGNAFYWNGKREKDRKWFNLSAQEIQPWYYRDELEDLGWVRSRGCPEDAWNGGSSLLLDGFIPASHASPVCARIFSLHVPLASKTLVSIRYKSSSQVTVSLELKMTRTGLFTEEHSYDMKLTSISPALLHEGHELVRQLTHQQGNVDTGWTVRFWKLDIYGFILREVLVNIQPVGEPCDTFFSCRLGEIMFLDIAGQQTAPEKVQDFCIHDIVWLRGAGSSPGSSDCCLYLNATLRWEYPTDLVRHFKVYYRQLGGPDPRMAAGQLVAVGRAYSKLYRITELPVLEPPGLLELVVEPITRKAFPLPESCWARTTVSYTDIECKNC
ncbi:cytosolic endo-beta-N-acetylglucosaminidase [Dunckerocampus dactyliophorus]|uniref:cytosolic endo-beta-N-acetylglucosaminidase n=1 Tax=Dunckerocampus dactyliophorus TaxID=161453 RepID=UPI0024055D4D|nr:cytosolic endo-beta-N-acetylglucosaminidase [Dunckerocampus dactyliophorus]